MLKAGTSPALKQDENQGLRFMENKNQWPANELFRGRLSAGQISLMQDRFRFVFFKDDIREKRHKHGQDHHLGHEDSIYSYHVFDLHFIGANDNSAASSEAPDGQYYNFFHGDDPSHWASHVSQYRKVTYHDIYHGVDMEVYGEGENIKYNWVLKAGADPSQIKVAYEGVDAIALKKSNIEVKTSAVNMLEMSPVAYQIINGQRSEVRCKFVLEGNEVHFEFPRSYDRSLPLIIDPTLVFSTYTGSTADNFGFTATYDAAGDGYAGGIVFFPGVYPTVGAFQSLFGGGSFDISITKFNPTGTSMIYSTYLGGNGDEQPHSLFVNDRDELYVFGSSNSSNYPTVAGAFDPSFNGSHDIIISRFSSSGASLLSSTYIGGSADDGFFTSPLVKNYADEARGEIYIDSLGIVYIASYTLSSNFPTTARAFNTTLNGPMDGCVLKLPPNLSSLLFSTYIGGSGYDAAFSIKLDQSRNIIIGGGTNSVNFPTTPGVYHPASSGGEDGYIAKLSNNGSLLIASTYLGTSAYDQVYFVEVDRWNELYAVGQTLGSYPVIGTVYSNPGAKQFIHKLNNDLTSTIVSTVFGSPSSSAVNISPTAFLVDRCDNIYVSGWGGNVNDGYAGGRTFGMPVTTGAIRTSTDGSDFYFIVLTREARSLLYATFFGGNGSVGEHVDGGTSRFDKEGVVYEAICSGCGGNSLFPTTVGAWSNVNRSSNCNLAIMKLAFNLAGTNVEVNASPRTTGCIPLTVNFRSVLTNVRSVVWHFGDGATSTATNPVHVYTDTGHFQVMLIGIDSASCNVADTAYLEVWARNDSITANFLPFLAVNCSTKTISARVRNFSTTNYSWNFGDGSVANTDSVFHVYASPGTYTVSLRVDDPNSCNGTNNFSFVVVIKPLVSLNAVLSDTAGCFPLTVNFTNSTPSTGAYRWDFGDGTFSTLRSPSHTYNLGGYYTVTLSMNDPNSCNVTDTLITHVRVYNDTVTPLYSIRRRFFGCDSVQVFVNSSNFTANRILWSFGDGSFSTSLNASHMYRDSGVYQILYVVVDSTKRCRMIDTVNEYVSLNPLDAAFSISDTNACVPAAVVFSDLSGYPDAESFWNFGDGNSDSGTVVTHVYPFVNTYRVMHIIIDSSVCNFADTSYTTTRTRNDSTQAYFTGIVLNSCDSQLVIRFINNSIDANQYEWYFGDGARSDSFAPMHIYTLPDIYRVMMISIDTNKCHPRDTAYANFTLRPNAVASFNMLPASCTGVSVLFNNTSNPSAAFVWQISDGTRLTGFNASHTFTSPGTYTVTLMITDTATCDWFDTVSIDINIMEYPIANFVMDRDSFYYHDRIQFTNTSLHFTNLMWRFGDGDSNDIADPIHIYEIIHEVRPCIIAYIAGTTCADTFCQDIYINFDPLIGIPNAFSPNGDGVNDVIKVEGQGIVELDFRIYNRWGEEVFHSDNKDYGWDGIYKGIPQEMDVYVYSAASRFLDGTRKTLKGNITLLR